MMRVLELIFMLDYVAARFHRPGVDAPAYCPISQRFLLAFLYERVASEIFFLLWAEKSPQLPAVGSIFNPKAEHPLCPATRPLGVKQAKPMVIYK